MTLSLLVKATIASAQLVVTMSSMVVQAMTASMVVVVSTQPFMKAQSMTIHSNSVVAGGIQRPKSLQMTALKKTP